MLSSSFSASQGLFMLYKLSHGQVTENGPIITFARRGTKTAPFLLYETTEPQL